MLSLISSTLSRYNDLTGGGGGGVGITCSSPRSVVGIFALLLSDSLPSNFSPSPSAELVATSRYNDLTGGSGGGAGITCSSPSPLIGIFALLLSDSLPSNFSPSLSAEHVASCGSSIDDLVVVSWLSFRCVIDDFLLLSFNSHLAIASPSSSPKLIAASAIDLFDVRASHSIFSATGKSLLSSFDSLFASSFPPATSKLAPVSAIEAKLSSSGSLASCFKSKSFAATETFSITRATYSVICLCKISGYSLTAVVRQLQIISLSSCSFRSCSTMSCKATGKDLNFASGLSAFSARSPSSSFCSSSRRIANACSLNFATYFITSSIASFILCSNLCVSSLQYFSTFPLFAASLASLSMSQFFRDKGGRFMENTSIFGSKFSFMKD